MAATRLVANVTLLLTSSSAVVTTTRPIAAATTTGFLPASVVTTTHPPVAVTTTGVLPAAWASASSTAAAAAPWSSNRPSAGAGAFASFLPGANSSVVGGNHTIWLTREEVEHFLGDPTVLHAIALALGVAAIAFGRRLPTLLAGISSVSLGLWVGLVVQDRQVYDQPLVGGIELPDGAWLPIVTGLLTAIAAGVLGLFAWRAALVLLTAGLFTMIALAICRLANASPEHMMQVAGSLLSAYRVVGSVVLVVTILIFALLVRRFHKAMIAFSSAHLGTLLLLSGVSYFAQVSGASEAPFSLLDDFARIMAEVRGGRCKIWGGEGGSGSGLQGCDCGEQCRSEIVAWLASSVTVLCGRFVMNKCRKRSSRGQKPSDEEKAPLAESGAASPEVIGRQQA